MTREEAIAIFMSADWGWLNEEEKEAFRMAIEALSADGDLISRADAIEALEKNKSDWDNDYNRPIDKDIQAIKALPSADAVSREVYEKRTQADERIIDSYRREFSEVASAVHKPDYSYEADMVKRLRQAEAVHIHNDGTLEVKVPNAQKVCRVLVVDADSHIGGGLFYPDEAVQGEWIHNEARIYTCSKCGTRHSFISVKPSNYCPNCGAMMTPYKGCDSE